MTIEPRPGTPATGITHLAPDLLERAALLSSATVHEAGGKIGVMPWQIKPVHKHFRVCGPAVTVRSPGGDNLQLHRAIYEAEPGDVLVVHCEGKYDHGYWGEVMSTAAKVRRLGGLVIDGCVRDFELLNTVGFPVFARGQCIRGTVKDKTVTGVINIPVSFEDLTVRPGDLVIGDNDGVVVVPRDRVAEVVAASEKRDDDEVAICRRLEAGETTLEIYNLG